MNLRSDAGSQASVVGNSADKTCYRKLFLREISKRKGPAVLPVLFCKLHIENEMTQSISSAASN